MEHMAQNRTGKGFVLYLVKKMSRCLAAQMLIDLVHGSSVPASGTRCASPLLYEGLSNQPYDHASSQSEWRRR
jgi:hypothetical protein